MSGKTQGSGRAGRVASSRAACDVEGGRSSPDERDAVAGAVRRYGRARESARPAAEKPAGLTEISDNDYRCVWRPCPTLDDFDESDGIARKSAATERGRRDPRESDTDSLFELARFFETSRPE